MSFVHLHTHSHYSLLDGLTRIEELVTAAKADRQPALAITDHGTMYGAVEFSKACRKAGIKPIIGMEAYLAPRSRHDREKQVNERAYHHLVLIAKNKTGYQNLLQLSTLAHLEGFYYKPRIDWELLERYGDGLIALTACLGGEIPRLIVERNEQALDAAIRRYTSRFGNDFYFELQHRSDIPETKIVNAKLIELGKRHNIPLVATNDIHYLHPEDAEAQDVLLCLQTKSKQTEQNRLCMMGEHYGFRTAKEMALLFEDHPEAIENTVCIADACTFELELGKIQLPKFPLPKGETNESYLRRLCEEGVERRYALLPQQEEADSRKQIAGSIARVRERMEYELGVIEQMGLASYFLIVQDFVNWAKQNGIVVGPGRGSAAGSIVSYLCNVTNLDPLSYDLLFERFLAPGRIQMPDIDIDFADHRRDEVIRYVKGRYGDNHVAQIITFGTMAARAAVRDVGRVLDVPYQFCDRLAKLIPFGSTLADAERDVVELHELIAADETTQKLFTIARRLEGVARHASTHACGVVITADPLVDSVPLQRASADDATIVTQFEMHAVEDLGLLKMDFLGLSNLSIIEHAVNTIRDRGTPIDVDQLPLDDAATYALLQRGETTGVFQLESGGMKRYLKELKPTEFEDIVAMVSLYRPGPMELIPEYIDRKFGRKPVTYLHPKLEPILKRTYGIMVYQEQLMSLARDLAGFTMSEADTLRKAVGKKIKKLLDEQREKLTQGMVAHGIMPKIAAKIWEWIEPFARYGFNRSHGACYAMIAYQTAYLKSHYPTEFMAALLTSERGNTDRLAVLIQECREMGIAVVGPDLNESEALFTVVDHPVDVRLNDQFLIPNDKTNPKSQIPNPKRVDSRAIRFGLAGIKNVGEHLVEVLVAERKAHGPYRDLVDMLQRVQDKDFNKKSLECLIKSGCLDRYAERGQLLANVDALLAHARTAQQAAASKQANLFGGTTARAELRLAAADPTPQRMRLAWEKELLGLYLSAHPFAATATALGNAIVSIAELKTRHGEQPVSFGGVVTRVKRITTKGGEGMLFAEVEDHTGSIEAVVFPRVLIATAAAWIPETVVLVRGKLSDRDGVPKVLADHAVAIVPGHEAEALQMVGHQSPAAEQVRYGAGTRAPEPQGYSRFSPSHREGERKGVGNRVVLQLPADFPPSRLIELKAKLLTTPGPTPVLLRTTAGRSIATGVRVAWAPELRLMAEELLGKQAVVEEVGEVVQ
jgi:DNA polymerase-3 subunit alpha